MTPAQMIELALCVRNSHDRQLQQNIPGFETLDREIRDQISLCLQAGDIDEVQARQYEGLLED